MADVMALDGVHTDADTKSDDVTVSKDLEEEKDGMLVNPHDAEEQINDHSDEHGVKDPIAEPSNDSNKDIKK